MNRKSISGVQRVALERALGRQLSRREFLKLAAGGVAASILVSCAPEEAETTEPTDVPATSVPATVAPAAAGPKRGGVFVLGQSHDIYDVDPHSYNSTADNAINRLMFNALTVVNQTGDPAPDLAESWEWVDNTNLVFALRQGVLFHNGRECTADDVKFSLERLVGPPPFSDFGAYINEIQEVIAEDKYTVRVVTPKYSARLLTTLADAKIVAKESIEEAATDCIGTGPFRKTNFIPGEIWEGERFSDYFDADNVYLEGFKISQYKDAQPLLAAAKAGQVHGYYNPPAQYDAEMEENPDLSLVWGKLPTRVGVFTFDMQSEPFNDKRVRKAFRYACNSDAIRQAAYAGRGESNWWNHPFPTNHWAFNPNLEPYPFDVQEARRLLDEAGLSEGYVMSAITRTANNPEATVAMEVLQRDLAGIGLDLQIDDLDHTAWLDVIQPAEVKRYPNTLVNFASAQNPLPDSLMFFLGWNTTSWDMVPQIAEMAAEAGAEPDVEKQKAIFWEIQEIIAEEVPMIFFASLPFANIVSKTVQDAWTDFTGYLRAEHAWFDQA